MLPNYPQFKTIEIADLPSLKPYFQANQPEICELAIGNFFIWEEFDRPKFTFINDNLCFLIEPINEALFFLPPLGTNQLLETIAVCLKYCGKVSRAQESLIKQLPENQYKIGCLRPQFDYLYETRILAEFKGRKFDGKRNHVKRFRACHPDYAYQPLLPEHKNKCLKLFEDWFTTHQESKYFTKLAHEAQRSAVEKAFHYFSDINCIGGILLIEKEVKGFIMASPLNKQTLSVHFLYGHPSIQGIFPTLLQETCAKNFADYKCVNLEQDLGIPGLRQSKLSYSPQLVKKFEITT
jgi:hypothetical protein